MPEFLLHLERFRILLCHRRREGGLMVEIRNRPGDVTLDSNLILSA